MSTIDRIETVEPGPEMDAAIASKVMGWDADQTDVYAPLFRPSTDIGAAMRVVDHLEESGVTIELRYSSTNKRWSCRIEDDVSAGPTAAMAICQTALARSDDLG